MSKIIKVLIQNSLYENINRKEVKNNGIWYLPDLYIFNLLSVFLLVRRILNDYPNYPTRRLYFGEVEIPYILVWGKQTSLCPRRRQVWTTHCYPREMKPFNLLSRRKIAHNPRRNNQQKGVISLGWQWVVHTSRVWDRN